MLSVAPRCLVINHSIIAWSVSFLLNISQDDVMMVFGHKMNGGCSCSMGGIVDMLGGGGAWALPQLVEG